MQHEQFSVAWMRLTWMRMSCYHLGLPLTIVHWKATVWKNSNFYWNLIKLYSTQDGFGHVCVQYTMWLPVSLWRRVLSWDSLLAYVLPNWSIKWKNIDSRRFSVKKTTFCNKYNFLKIIGDAFRTEYVCSLSSHFTLW